MATYEELYSLRSDNVLKNRLRVAIAIKAASLLTDQNPSVAAVQWARGAVSGNLDSLSDQWFLPLIAALKDKSADDIKSIADADLQKIVNRAVDLIAGGE